MNLKNKSTLERFYKILKVKNYSKRTIEIYIHYAEKFLSSFDKSALHITKKDIEDYLLNHNYSSISKQNQIISSLKHFSKHILNIKRLDIKGMERPRKEKNLPKIIDSDLLVNTIHNIQNLKHKAIIQLAYCCALRVSEVINLKIEDIDSKRMLIYIRNSKFNKSRYVPISESTLETLREYFKEYRPKEYLFNGQFDLIYSSSSCNNIVKKYLSKEYHFHLLRHSGLTHMLENGTDLRILQVIAGHEKSDTTSIYAHVSLSLLNKVNLPI